MVLELECAERGDGGSELNDGVVEVGGEVGGGPGFGGAGCERGWERRGGGKLLLRWRLLLEVGWGWRFGRGRGLCGSGRDDGGQQHGGGLPEQAHSRTIVESLLLWGPGASRRRMMGCGAKISLRG